MRVDGFDNLHSLPQPELKRRVAEEFEQIFASMMLRSMRSTTYGNELIPQSFGEKVYTEMLDGEVARLLSSQSGLGLAELILKELDKGEESTVEIQPRAPSVSNSKSIRMHESPAKAAGRVAHSVHKWKDLIGEAAQIHGVSPDLISAVITQESAGNPHAISRAGAKGLMQLMDGTARDMGVTRVFDPRQNIMGGTRYLKEMLTRFGGDERLALAAYNAGPSAVERYKGIPPFTETREYVERVLNIRNTLVRHIAQR